MNVRSALVLAALVAASVVALPASSASAATVQNVRVDGEPSVNDATIAWDAVSDAQMYRMFWSTSSSGMFGACEPTCTKVTPQELAAPEFSLKDAFDQEGSTPVDGQTYYLKVSAIDGSGRTITGWQNTPTKVDLVGDPPQIPDVVQNIRVDGTPTADDATVAWDRVPTAVQYRFFWSTRSSGMSGRCEPNCMVFTPNFQADPAVTLQQAFALTGQTPIAGQTYYVKVSALDTSGHTITGWQDQPTRVDLAGDPQVIPDVVQNVRAEGIGDDDATIRWDRVYTAVQYRVFWSTRSSGMSGRCEPNCTVIDPATPADPSITLHDAFAQAGQTVRAGQTYYVKVSAIGPAGHTLTGWQNQPTTFELTGDLDGIPDTVQNIHGESIGDDDATILWDAVPTAGEYRVYWSEDSHMASNCEPTCTVITPAAPNAPSVALSDALAAVGATVRAGTKYYIKVSAISGGSTITSWQDDPAEVQLTGDQGPEQATLQPLNSNSSGSSATAKATFAIPTSGQATQLQMLTIVDDNNSTADWKTVDTGHQDSGGNTTFGFSNPLEVEHRYRVTSGATVSNLVKFKPDKTTKNTGLSTIYIDTNDGHSVNTRSHYFYGAFEMTESTEKVDDNGTPLQLSDDKTCEAADSQDMKIKGRGNYSWSFSKKSFTLSLDNKDKLCGLHNDKKFALISNAYDKTLLRGAAAFTLGSILDSSTHSDKHWTPRFRPVDLYINGSYQGAYQLLERIDVDNDRVDVDELKTDGNRDGSTEEGAANNVEPGITGGYLLEWDFRRGGDHNVQAGSRGYVAIKSPEDEDGTEGISTKQISYIDGYLDATDKALFGSNFKSSTSGYRKYIDVDSAIDYWIAQEIMKPVDGNFWASVYMYKPRNGKLYFGPLWDYDLSSGSAAREANTVSPTGWYLRNRVTSSARQSTDTWLNRMFQDPWFVDQVKKRWNDDHLYSQLYEVHQFLDDQKPIMAKSVSENFKKWDIREQVSPAQQIKGSYGAEFSYLHNWLETRIKWINGQLD